MLKKISKKTKTQIWLAIYYTIQLKNGIHRDSNPLFALPLTSWR